MRHAKKIENWRAFEFQRELCQDSILSSPVVFLFSRASARVRSSWRGMAALRFASEARFLEFGDAHPGGGVFPSSWRGVAAPELVCTLLLINSVPIIPGKLSVNEKWTTCHEIGYLGFIQAIFTRI